MIYLMRHGQDDEHFIGGWSDVSLLPKGKEEVEEAGAWIKENLKVKQIICSPVFRAKETANIVNQYLQVPLFYSDSLREQSKGLLNGMLKEEAKKKYGDWLEHIGVDTLFPEGESLRDLYLRMQTYLAEIMCYADDTLLITHRGVINMIYYLLYEKELDMDKEQFGVETSSIHALSKENRMIKRIR